MKPILFTVENIKKIFNGSKTVTRRVVKPQPHAGVRKSPFHPSGMEDGHGREIKCLYNTNDSILWVREPFCLDPIDGYYYKASADEYEDYNPGEWKWKPSIHMPFAAARLFLVIQSITLQKLQVITDEDCYKEGCDEVAGFPVLWDSINKTRGVGWDTDPYVWRIEFEVKK